MPTLAVPFPGQSGTPRHVHVFGNPQKSKDPAQHGLVVLLQVAAAHNEHLVAGEVPMQAAHGHRAVCLGLKFRRNSGAT